MSRIQEVPDLDQLRTDEELVEIILNGRSDLFGELYARFKTRAFRLAYGMLGNRESAADLTQEIFMRAYQRLDQYQRRSAFSTWFYRLAVNTCLNYRTRERRHKDEANGSLDLSLVPSPESDGEERVLRKQVQDQLQMAMSSLKPELRIVVV
ncbi:MAG TPA: RNA polymerase sigma factor, partial [Blastocatellia bacterium]|nr:RNA polymerase sigma factor [Blastocatellia bacterium]